MSQTRKPRQEPRWRFGILTSALLPQLNSSATLGPAVGLLGLPRRDSRPLRAGARCRVAGWGFVSNFEELPPGLMEAEVRVLGLGVCNSSWEGQLSPAMLCTQSGDRRRRGFCSVGRSFSTQPRLAYGETEVPGKGQSWTWGPGRAEGCPGLQGCSVGLGGSGRCRAAGWCVYRQCPAGGSHRPPGRSSCS